MYALQVNFVLETKKQFWNLLDELVCGKSPLNKVFLGKDLNLH